MSRRTNTLCYVDLVINNHTPYELQVAQLVPRAVALFAPTPPNDPFTFWADADPREVNPPVAPHDTESFRITRNICVRGVGAELYYKVPWNQLIERIRLAVRFPANSSPITPLEPYPGAGYYFSDLAPMENCADKNLSLTNNLPVNRGPAGAVATGSTLPEVADRINTITPAEQADVLTTTQFAYLWIDLSHTFNRQILHADVYLKDARDRQVAEVNAGRLPFSGLKVCFRETDIGGPSCIPLSSKGTPCCLGQSCPRYLIMPNSVVNATPPPNANANNTTTNLPPPRGPPPAAPPNAGGLVVASN